MTVAKFNQPDASAQTGTNYKANIDASIQVLMQLAANFAAHAADTPDMTVIIDAGKLWNGSAYIMKAQQTTVVFSAPINNPRIDRIAIDITTGNYVVIPGIESATPVAPDYSAGHFPICQILFLVSQASIANTDIIDERALIQKHPINSGDIANKIAFRVGLSANQTIPSLVKVALDTAQINTLDYFDTVNYIFNPQVPGNYFFSARLLWTAVSAGNNLNLRLYKNNSLYSTQYTILASGETASSISTIIPLNGTTDFVELRAVNNNSSTSQIFASAYDSIFEGFLVG